MAMSIVGIIGNVVGIGSGVGIGVKLLLLRVAFFVSVGVSMIGTPPSTRSGAHQIDDTAHPRLFFQLLFAVRCSLVGMNEFDEFFSRQCGVLLRCENPNKPMPPPDTSKSMLVEVASGFTLFL